MLSVGRNASCWLLAMGMLICSGCGGDSGPELFDVTGTVTLNGKPLPNAEVTFQPKEGAPSFARTDDEGKYELKYSRDRYGALPGSHEVSITTAAEDDDGNVADELLPAKYNIDTELTANVTDEGNPIDFQLESDGKVVQISEDDPDPDAAPAGNPAGDF